jgi:NADH:ubiquinone oxidoreductase subunit 4 (subunit M)
MFYYIQIFILVGFFISGIICFRQIDIKSLIAYSSIQHMMLGVLGIISFRFSGSKGMILIALRHGFISSGLFFMFKILYKNTSSRKILLNFGYINIIPIFVFF